MEIVMKRIISVMKIIIALSLTTVLNAAAAAIITSPTAPVVTPVATNQSNASNTLLLLVGPLQSYNVMTGTAVILGQNIHIGVRSLQAGLTFSVFGTINSNGSFNVSSISGGNVYVPGATDVFLTGVVKTSNPMLDLITVGGATVDLTLALASGGAMPPVGAAIQLVGTQPSIGGVILAKAMNVGPLENITNASQMNDIGITGSGLIGIQH